MFPAPPLAFVTFWFDNDHSIWDKTGSQWGFHLHFPNRLGGWELFHIFIGHLNLFQKVFSSFDHLLIGLLVLSMLKNFQCIYSGYYSSVRWTSGSGKDFLWFYRLPLDSVVCFIYCVEAFQCDAVPFVNSHFISWVTGILLRKSLPIPISRSISPICPCSNFKVSDLILYFFIHFEFYAV